MIIKRNIILIGSMGSGKSHFGRNLAEMKNWQFVDTDRVLEGRFGLPIAEIFKKIGEKAFKKAIERIPQRRAYTEELKQSVYSAEYAGKNMTNIYKRFLKLKK